MKPIERFIVGIDGEPWNVIVRGAIGFALPPFFRALTGGYDSVWITSALFIGVLLAWRLGPAILRRLLPFSVEAKRIWAARRELAKEYDSYAWQKLFWIGLGLLLYSSVGGGLQRGELVVMLFCMICGGAGLIVWRRARVVRLEQ